MSDTTLPTPPGGAKANDGPRRRLPRKGRHGRVRRGFGLHDWLNLCRRARDLAQRKGAPLRRDIAAGEVKLHDKPHDGWVILRGRVYNVAPYLAYHPGGSEIVEKCLGRDATKLFDKYHAWVNLESLIGPLLLGSLKVERMGGIGEEGGGCLTETVAGGGNNNAVPPTNAAAKSDDPGFSIPKLRPPKREPMASLLPPDGVDGEGEDDALML